MADVSEPISALPAASTVQPTDLYIISQDNGDGTFTSKKAASSIVQTATGNVTAPAVLTANAPIIGGGGKTVSAMAALTTGQIIVGSTGNAPVATATPSISLANATGLPVSTGISGLGTNVATFLATPSSANLRGALSDETGTGLAYFQGGDIGTPSAGVLTNATGLPISTGVSGLGTGVGTFLATPSSANLAAAVTNETGSGALVFATSPTLVTPTLGVANATSVNGSTLGIKTQQIFLSGSSATYTTPANCRQIVVRMVGGGGGGPGTSSAARFNGTAGANTIFNSINAVGGAGGTALPGYATTSGTGTANLRRIGSAGGMGIGGGFPSTATGTIGGNGGSSLLGGTTPSSLGTSSGTSAIANTGSGGSSAANANATANITGSGGQAGEYVEVIIVSPAATYTYTVGSGGAGGSGGTENGGAGGSGVIIVDEYY